MLRLCSHVAQCVAFALEAYGELRKAVGSFSVLGSSPFGARLSAEALLYCIRFAEGDSAVLMQVRQSNVCCVLCFRIDETPRKLRATRSSSTATAGGCCWRIAYDCPWSLWQTGSPRRFRGRGCGWRGACYGRAVGARLPPSLLGSRRTSSSIVLRRSGVSSLFATGHNKDLPAREGGGRVRRMLGLELAIGYGVKLAVTGGLYYYVRSSLREVEAPALRAWLVDQGGPLPATPADVARAEDEAYREQSVGSSSSGDEAAPGDPATEQEEPCEGPLQLVDVRTQYEFDAGHIDGSLLVSLVPPWSIKQRLCECISRANSIVVVDYNGLRSMAIVKVRCNDARDVE